MTRSELLYELLSLLNLADVQGLGVEDRGISTVYVTVSNPSDHPQEDSIVIAVEA